MEGNWNFYYKNNSFFLFGQAFIELSMEDSFGAKNLIFLPPCILQVIHTQAPTHI